MANDSSESALASEFQIEVFGEDLDGGQFIEHTRTLIITREGAIIPMACKLAPDSELIIRNPVTNEEALARVVGLIPDATFLQVYGIVFIDSSVNLWQVAFPEITSKESINMECTRCHAVDVIQLNEIEMTIFESTQTLMRRCECHNSSTMWRRTDRRVTEKRVTQRQGDDQRRQISSIVGPATQTPQERRRGKRTAMKAAGCIRCYEGDVFFECEDVSRGGFRFKSRETFSEGMSIEAAVPYAKNSINIFVPARIAYHQALSSGFHRYGVAYVGPN